MEELSHQVRVLQAQITEVHQRLRCNFGAFEKINNLEHLKQIEDSLRESIHRVNVQKLQEGMTLPLMMASLQESQPLSWLLNNDNHQLLLPNEPKFLPFSDNTNRDAECPTDISLPSYSSYIGSNKLEVGSSPQVTTLGQGGGAMNELSGTSYLNVQCCDQFAFPPPQDIEEVKHFPTMNNKSNTADYQVNNFDLSSSLFDNGHQFLNSASGSCGIAMYNENGYHRVVLRKSVCLKWRRRVEMRGIDPRTSRMLSERSTI
ncbi:unnamed protein product [Sphenostylis stenocarpa]|uniref:Uncharacterized protein n=1 Tax=Sphenostylis stenocarpa TaxID=92480 RepID=A0AA86VKY6_9FABA|nr:unnamed protein product [Sphenostylis stenocarpa]